MGLDLSDAPAEVARALQGDKRAGAMVEDRRARWRQVAARAVRRPPAPAAPAPAGWRARRPTSSSSCRRGPDGAGVADHAREVARDSRPNRRIAGRRRLLRPARATRASRPQPARLRTHGPARARVRPSTPRRRRSRTSGARPHRDVAPRRADGSATNRCWPQAPRDGPPSPARGRRRARRRPRATARPRESARPRRQAARGPAAADAVRASARPHGCRAFPRSAAATCRQARPQARACTGKGPHGVARLPRRSIAQPANAA